MSNSIVDKAAIWVLLFVAGWIACSGYYQIPHLWKSEALVPKLADAAGCETARANIAQDQLGHSLTDGMVDTSAIPNCKAAPKVKAILGPSKK